MLQRLMEGFSSTLIVIEESYHYYAKEAEKMMRVRTYFCGARSLERRTQTFLLFIMGDL
jgi:hypothetical protein